MPPSSNSPRLSRRVLFAGAGTAGAVAAVTAVLPVAPSQAPAAEAKRQPPERGGGYVLSEHVKRYYQTTRI